MASYLSFNSLGKSYVSFNRGEDFLEINQSETRIARKHQKFMRFKKTI
jgi:hypothetical protein